MRSILSFWFAVGVGLTAAPQACPGQEPLDSTPHVVILFPSGASFAQQKNPPADQKRETADFSLDLPGPTKLFVVRSETALREEIRENATRRGITKTQFPQDAQLNTKD